MADASASAPLSWFAAGLAALVIGVELFRLLLQPDLAAVDRDPLVRLTTLAAALLGGGLFALHRYRVLSPSPLLGLTMAFTVIAAVAIAFVETTLPFDPSEPVRGVSAIGPWILLFGVLAPFRRGWTIATSMAAASTWPLVFAINAARFDYAMPSWDRLAVWPGINYLLAAVGCVLCRRTYQMKAAARTARELGSYRLLGQIGEGGMGEVWRASHHLLARQAAIKLIRPSATGSFSRQADTWIRRFQREANVIAGLQSPHTIYLYDFGVSNDGQFYYVMELLDGVSLQTLVSTFGPQPAARVRSILRQICESLEEAHQQGLVHRDLKPSNVMLCKLALSYDFVKVLDFGLAKCAACEETTQLTMEGTAAGTPGYIAPEVALGEPDIDARADIYALGCLGYFLLTGTLVFPDSNPMSMALKHVQAPPDPPSARTELPVPADLERVIMRCLEKKPGDRPPSARELARWLDAVDVPAWTEDAAMGWWERNLPPGSTLRSVAQAPSGPEVARRTASSIVGIGARS
jgi:serine/threonine-protein kinase